MNHSLVLPFGTCGDRPKRGDAVGPTSGQSPFLGDPEAKFCWGERGQRQIGKKVIDTDRDVLPAHENNPLANLRLCSAPKRSAYGVAGASHKPRLANT